MGGINQPSRIRVVYDIAIPTLSYFSWCLWKMVLLIRYHIKYHQKLCYALFDIQNYSCFLGGTLKWTESASATRRCWSLKSTKGRQDGDGDVVEMFTWIFTHRNPFFSANYNDLSVPPHWKSWVFNREFMFFCGRTLQVSENGNWPRFSNGTMLVSW